MLSYYFIKYEFYELSGHGDNRDSTLGIVDNYRVPFDGMNYNCSRFDDICLKSNLVSSDDNDLVEFYPSNISDASSSRSPLVTNGIAASSNNNIKENLKRKRRQWSVAEKLRAIATYELNKNKRRAAAEHGCTPAQF